MSCLVIRLSLDAECGACGHTVPPGLAVITDQIEPPVFVPVCEGCELGLDGVAAAAALRGAKPGGCSKAARSGQDRTRAPASKS